ncbi:MAG: ATP synthase subunit I [Phycisphaeraceae bacterium]|nr:ATP synthase subunit I [Phycisphaeraceae bacterium]
MSPMEFAVPAPSTERIESTIAHDLAKKCALVAPIVVLGLGIWRGPDAALGAALALAIVVVNFLAAAWILGWTARHAPHALTGVALMSFLVRLGIITALGAGIKALDVVDWPAFCFTLIGSYLVLLFWELRSVSLTLAYPGLKPKPGHHEE